MRIIRKLVLCVMLAMMILAACKSSTLSFSEIEHVPDNVEEIIDPALELQMINEAEKGSYIVFQTNGEVDTDLVAEGDTITVKFDTKKPQSDSFKQHVYYLTTDPEHDIIDVQVNGESMPFDVVTGF